MYDTAAAFRQAIEARLNQRAMEDGVEVNRVRRGFVFERIMAAIPSLEHLSPPDVEVAATTQHFAEKLHALTRDYGAQLNTRIREPDRPDAPDRA